MTASATESAFQNDILREMVAGGWVLGKADRYDRERALYPKDCLVEALKATGLPVETGSGARTPVQSHAPGPPKDPCAGGRLRQESRRVCRARGGAGVRPFQPSDRRWRRPRPLLPSLPRPTTRQWRWLFLSTQTRNGGSEMGGLTALCAVRYPAPS